MAQGRTLNTQEDIIATGQALEREKGVGMVTAWDVFKALGSKGKYSRIEELWNQHLSSRTTAPIAEADELPEQLVIGIESALATAATGIRALCAAANARQTASHVRQVQSMDSHHADVVAAYNIKVESLEKAFAARGEELSHLAHREEELMEELERERVLRRAAEEAAARATRLPWSLPVVGDHVPLVSPLRTIPVELDGRPAPDASQARRNTVRRAKSAPTAEDTVPYMPGIVSGAAPDPNQLDMGL
ncbi:hypothetical protein [Rubellimicrobium aerolatum]|uniref:KfrA N-terminal DNA-binding domain-containing protein n=1 Tax=Rubellimicrobium aerolatum TaxID=490979 RepID=A0ABW0S8Q6_9RHOB|nr:hypothetical protein [Rubellimicrobium aerolatum]MBP1804667.1 hypothetical protein [Rubellimicrobium aerolatum]